MSDDFDHVLLTRFSAVLGDGAPASQEWLDYRLGFFYDACYASVTRQREAEFDWLVLFDDRCADDFREQIEELAEGAFTPIWTHERFRRDSFAGPVAALTASRIAKRASGRKSHLITTRIDSDDAMAVDFMASVQREFAGQDRLFVNFARGIQIERSGAVLRTDTLSSPFLSLIERRTEAPPDTVYVAKHARARAHGPIREVRGPVMWAQVVHGVNLSNITNGTRVSPAIVRERFDMDLGFDESLSGTRLLAARTRHLGALGRLWAHHPGELTKWVEAKAWGLRGTHERSRDDGATFTDRVQRLEQTTVQRWRSSEARARARATVHGGRDLAWRLRGHLSARGESAPTVLAGDLQAALAADRVVVLAEHAGAREVRATALTAAAAYAELGLGVILVAAREPWHTVRAPAALPPGVVLASRANAGYDFGTWSAALAAWPELADKDLVVLTNDSLIGPLAPLDVVLDRATASGADVWAPTESSRPRPHLQSPLLVFRRGVLGREPLRGFFASVERQGSKHAVIETYELGLTQLLDEHGISRAAGWTNADLGVPLAANPMFVGWRELLEAGFPFFKRSLLEMRHLRDLRGLVLDYVDKRFGWTPPRQ